MSDLTSVREILIPHTTPSCVPVCTHSFTAVSPSCLSSNPGITATTRSDKVCCTNIDDLNNLPLLGFLIQTEIVYVTLDHVEDERHVEDQIPICCWNNTFGLLNYDSGLEFGSTPRIFTASVFFLVYKVRSNV